MGNSLTCFAPKGPRQKASRCSHDPVDDRKIETAPRSSSSSVKKEIIDDEILRQQAVAAVLLLKQHQQQQQQQLLQNCSFPQFDRSTSVQYPLTSSKKQNKLPRSSSSRPSSLLDPPAHHLNNQDLKVDDDLETKHFVLVHGGGFGAWCWYKSMAFLKEAGFEADAIDLTGSGIDATDSNSITSFAQYVKPLVDFLENLGDGQKVILVGHDFGGFCVSYVMELFPSKVSKAIFVAAAMLTSGQSTLTAFQGQSSSSDLMQQAQKFIYANGKDNPPTAISLDKSLLSDLLYNLSPTKDAVLASVSMRPMPFAPIMEKLSLSEANYGSIPRFYIKTEEDFAIPVSLQEFMIKTNPPEQVFQLKGSDHSPFFSRPQALHKLLLELSKIPPKQVSSPNSLDGALTEKA